MITTDSILNFANTHKVFTRKELLSSFRKQNQHNSFSEQLSRLLKSGQLIRIDRGVYKLTNTIKTNFAQECSDEMKNINQQINSQFPFIDYCLWSGSILIPYMHHIPNIHIILLDVEREATEAVFNFLNVEGKQIFLKPSLTDFERYVATTNAIVIRPLVSESPLLSVNEINTPAIEKILVDIIGDVEFSFIQGIELDCIYTSIFEKHKVNKRKLLRYASRRGRKNEVERMLNTNKL